MGFCYGNPEMVRALATIKGYYDYGHFAPIQIASIMALRHGDEFVAEQCVIYQKRRDILVKGLRKIGWDVESPRASMFVWARVSDQHLAHFGTPPPPPHRSPTQNPAPWISASVFWMRLMLPSPLVPALAPMAKDM